MHYFFIIYSRNVVFSLLSMRFLFHPLMTVNNRLERYWLFGCEGQSCTPLCHTAILSPLFITSTAKTFAKLLSQMSFPIPFHFISTSSGAITPKYLQNIFITIPIIAESLFAFLFADCCSRFANDSNVVSISREIKAINKLIFFSLNGAGSLFALLGLMIRCVSGEKKKIASCRLWNIFHLN